MRESVIEDAVVKHAEATGWISRKMTYVGRHGCRDRDFYGFGKVVMIELKRPGQNPRPHQERERLRLRDKGITIHVIDDVKRGCDLLDRLAAA